MEKLIFLLFLIFPIKIFAVQDCLIYLPSNYRQHNRASSCTFASCTTCLRALHMWKTADKFWHNNGGPGNPHNVGRALDEAGVKYKMYTNGETKPIIESLEKGRPVALTWGGAHMVTMVGIINNHAYIIDNNHPTEYTIKDWPDFVRYYNRGGGWCIIFYSGWVSPPKDVKSLDEFHPNF